MSISAVLLISIAIGTTEGALLEYPRDLNVTIGQRVILNCTTDLDLPVYWYFNGHEIFYGGRVAMSFQTKFTVTTEGNGVYNLVISSVDDSYNGEYTCGDDEGQGERKSAHLSVTVEAVTFANAELHDTTSSSNVILALIIAGIVFLLAVGVGVTVAVCLCKKRAKHAPDTTSPTGVSAQSDATNKDREIQHHEDDETGAPIDTRHTLSAEEGRKLFETDNEKQRKKLTEEGIKRFETDNEKQHKKSKSQNYGPADCRKIDEIKTLYNRQTGYDDTAENIATHGDSEHESDNICTSTETDLREEPVSAYTAPQTASQLELDQNITDDLKRTAAPMADEKPVTYLKETDGIPMLKDQTEREAANDSSSASFETADTPLQGASEKATMDEQSKTTSKELSSVRKYVKDLESRMQRVVE